jgi:recombination protein RecA
MLTATSELETDTRKKNVQPGTQARAVNRVVRHVSSAFNSWPIDDPNSIDNQPAVIFLNQVREKIGVYGDPKYSPGGKGKDHQASIRIQMSKGEIHRGGGKDDKTGPAVAMTLKARCVKNKVWAPYQQGEFYFSIRNYKKKGVPYRIGEIDEVGQLMMLGLHYGLIERRGSVFEYDQVQAQGADNFKAELYSFDAGRVQLKDEILEAAWERKGL